MASRDLRASGIALAATATVAGCALATAGVLMGGRIEVAALGGALVVSLWLLGAAVLSRRRAARPDRSPPWVLPGVVAGLGSAVVSGSLLLGGPIAALAITAILLISLWWLEGPRAGRRLREAIFAAVALALVANYVSSWLGVVGEIPAGALLRDLAFVVLLAATFSELADEPGPTARLAAYAALAVVVIASLDTAGGLPAVVGARTYLIYPLILLAPAWKMSPADRLALIRGMVALLAGIAVLGLIEAATHGRALSTLGFDADFAETANTSATPDFQGFRRATGGLGNFLEFGLLMNIGLLLARASLRGPIRPIAIALFATAAFFSWSRLSWALTLLIALVPLGVVGERVLRVQARRLLGVGAVAVGAALLLTFGPSQVATDRIFGTDRITQRSNSTRQDQFSQALSEAGTQLLGTGPGSQGAAADRQEGRAHRTVTDNGYLIWLLELGWLGLIAIALLTVLLLSALVAASAWWAVVLVGVLAAGNALFAAADSRVVLVVGFIALRLLWPPREESAGAVRPAPIPRNSVSRAGVSARPAALTPAGLSRPLIAATTEPPRAPDSLAAQPWLGEPAATPAELDHSAAVAPASSAAPALSRRTASRRRAGMLAVLVALVDRVALAPTGRSRLWGLLALLGGRGARGRPHSRRGRGPAGPGEGS